MKALPVAKSTTAAAAGRGDDVKQEDIGFEIENPLSRIFFTLGSEREGSFPNFRRRVRDVAKLGQLSLCYTEGGRIFKVILLERKGVRTREPRFSTVKVYGAQTSVSWKYVIFSINF